MMAEEHRKMQDMDFGDARLEELAVLSGLEAFDKYRLKVLIEKVVVFEENAVEIVRKVRNPFWVEASI